MTKKILVVIVLIVAFLMVKTHITANLWCYITGRGYIIPQESSMLTFNATKMNEGSGEWWLYGEDKEYYYTMEKVEHNKLYSKISKKEAQKIAAFNKLDFKTWQIDNE